jgi:phosphoesterase RecJ-like protein
MTIRPEPSSGRTPQPVRNDHQNRIEAIAEMIAARDRFLLLTHINPDGDALGSLLALGEGLTALGKKVTMFYEGEVPEMYSFLPGLADAVSSPGSPDDYQVAVLLDCHTFDRVGPSAATMSGIGLRVVLDHHLVEGELPEFALVDPEVSAAGELVWSLLNHLGVRISPSMAVNLYVAVYTDTGAFSFSNTTADVLEIAADLVRAGADPWNIFSSLYLNRSPARLRLLGLALTNMELFLDGRVAAMSVTAGMMADTGSCAGDTDGFVEYPRSIKGTELAVLIRESGAGMYKVSLRSMGRINAAALAQTFNGGGHFQAAGCTVSGTLSEVKEKVVAAAADLLASDRIGGGR